MTRPGVLFLAILALGGLAHAAAPEFWRLEGAGALMKGDLENLSVDSEARLRLGPAVRSLFDPEAPNAWCVARDQDGALYVGTGNDGRLYRVSGDEGEVLFDADELEIHAVAIAPDGTIFAATSPDGAVYAIDGSGTSRIFFDPEESYIWALALDGGGNLLVATGGQGRVYRVSPDGTPTTILTSSDAHVLSLALDDRGRVFAGSSPEGIVYRIGSQGDVFVLLDSPFSEIKALAVGSEGDVFAAAVNGGASTAAPSAPPPPPAPSASPPTAQVTVTEALAPIQPAAVSTVSVAPVVSSSSGATTKGAVLRVDAGGAVETLWTSAADVPHSLVSVEGGVLLGSGDKGHVYRIRRDGSWTLAASLPAQQVTGLAPASGQATAVVTANPARVYALSGAVAEEGTLVTEVKDATVVASWGRVRWEGRTPGGTGVRLETRSGNTSKPDATWGEWTDVDGDGQGGSIRSESSRFLQLRVTLAGSDGASPEIEALSTAFLQRNLRPRVTSITVHPPGEVFQKPLAVSGEPEVLGLETDPLAKRGNDPGMAGVASVTSFSRKFQRKGLQTLVWTGQDPNGDALVYDVEYKALGDDEWRVLRVGLTEAVVAWDTTAMPDGRYVVRVTASDAPENPPALALTGEKDSRSFEIDNTAPTLAPTLAPGGRGIRVTARDAGSRILRLEYSVDADRWQEVYPVDGINDSNEETYEFEVETGDEAGSRVVVLRVTDRLGNVATGRIDVP